MFDDVSLWTQIGYKLVEGHFTPGSQVVLRRAKASTPLFFQNLVSADEAIQMFVFGSAEEQAEWVADSIRHDLVGDELELTDILIIMLDPLRVPRAAAVVISALEQRGLSAHIAGVTSSRDLLFVDGSVAITGIYRAKGNEAPMVYVMHGEYGFAGPELIKRRNALFTAITRSRAWVRVCGIGTAMSDLKEEFDTTVRRDFELRLACRPLRSWRACARSTAI
jgi:superfamily I DNA and RNA helicase